MSPWVEPYRVKRDPGEILDSNMQWMVYRPRTEGARILVHTEKKDLNMYVSRPPAEGQ